MFLKSAKKSFLNSMSITTRLTLFYSLATFLLLTIIALFLYGGMIDILYRSNYQLLANKIDTVQNILENRPNNLSALEREAQEIPTVLNFFGYHYLVRILDNKNQLIIETPGMSTALQGASFFNQTTLLSRESQRWNSINDKQYLLMQAPIKSQKLKQAWLIQAALDISYQQNIISAYLKTMLAILLAGSIFSIFLGYLIARRGMHSLDKLTDTTKKITATSLYRRIEPTSWPKELRTLGMSFNQMLDRIETSFSRLTQFSSDLAHELRTPVNNLMGETEVALTRPCSIEEYRQVLESNLEELQRISQLIENLLFLAYAENPQLEIKKELLNVGKEIVLIVEFYQAMADEKNIIVSSTGQAKLPANPIMFRRMISNNLANALKYTPAGGWVKFNIEETADHHVQITLRDNGIGIDAEHLPKIFNRFFRTDTARSQNSGGIGLGLAIVKSIVDLHQGSIVIESELKKGTTLLITFPK